MHAVAAIQVATSVYLALTAGWTLASRGAFRRAHLGRSSEVTARIRCLPLISQCKRMLAGATFWQLEKRTKREQNPGVWIMSVPRPLHHADVNS